MGLDIVRSTDAVAMGRIRKGDRCALFMEDGLLYAQTGRDAPSTGKADMDAEDGCMVPISGLSGVMDLRHGSIWFLNVTPARSGGGSFRIKRSDLPGKKGGKFRSGMRTIAMDMEALALLRRSGLRCDSELPLPEDVRAMLLRGLDVIALGTPFSISGLRAALGNLPQKISEVDIGPRTKNG
jgi:predicted transcriptional regulator